MDLNADFSSMFEILDTKKKKYLTVNEITSFYLALFGQTVGSDLANAVVKKVCSGSNCSVKHFQAVLVLMEEWRQRESNAYWDFKALDREGSGTIPMSNALFLARSVQGKEFSIEFWNAWRELKEGDGTVVCWDDFKSFLYFEPEGRFSRLKNEAEFDKTQDLLRKKELQDAVDDYQFYSASMERDEAYSTLLLQQRQEYQEDVHFEANRLTNRWNLGGVETVIHDDGTEWDQVVDRSSKDDVTITELLAALDEKYDILRDKLMWEIVKTQSSNESSLKKASNRELEEKFVEIKSREKEMRKNEVLEARVNMLYGSDVTYGHDLHVMMGTTADAYEIEWEATRKRYAAYKGEGKSTKQINEIFEKENLDKMRKSATTGGNILLELWNRQKEEKKQLLDRLRQHGGTSARLVAYTALYRQCERARDQDGAVGFEGSTSGVGVAERKQTFEPTRYSDDMARQERFASERLRLMKQQKKLAEFPGVGDRLKDISQDKNLAAVDSWMEICKLLEKKHNAEREVMVHLLQNIGGIEKNVSKLEIPQQERRKVELSRTFESWKNQSGTQAGKENKSSKRSYQISLLHEGVALYREQLKRDAKDRRDGEIAARILAQLQILQDIQFQEMHEQLKTKSMPEIYQLRKAEYRAVRDEHFENIGLLIFGSEKLSPEEQLLVDVILKKYDLLREKLFVEHLRHFNDEEKAAKVLEDLKNDERSNRGNRNHLEELCKRLRMSYSAEEIFGPMYSRFHASVVANQDATRNLAIEEHQLLDGKSENILFELDARYRDECMTILSDVRESNDVTDAIRRETREQLWELSTLGGDKSFLPSAIILGLYERMRVGSRRVRLREDNARYIRCAQERFVLPEPFNEKANKYFVSDNANAEKALRLLTSRHSVEWKHLRTLMNDVTAEELREAASLMTLEERVQRLAEINKKRKSLDLSQPDGKEDLLSLLEEAAAIKHVSRKEILLQLVGESGASNEDVFISLLADLQEEQLNDGFHWLHDVFETNVANASSASDRIEQHINTCENIFNILCKYEGTADDEHLLQALEDKYDSLRDKLLAEALMRMLGEDAWRRMSEQERQARLLKLKLEEQRLRKEGKMDELARLLGDAFANDARMKGLLGESREMYEKKLRERLEAMKRGEIPPDDDLEDSPDLTGTNNPLVDLASRLDEERDALMKLLSGQDDLLLSEKERQAALLRLRQSRMKADGEDRYDAAALVSGLADRESAAEKRLKSDRERQRELARRRLADLKNKAGRLPVLSEEDEKIIRSGDRTAMEESVFKKLRFLQSWERAWMTSLLTSTKDPFTQIGALSTQQIMDRLQNSRSKVPSGPVRLQDNVVHLSDAAFHRQVALARHVTDRNDQSRDELKVTLLVGLQDAQGIQEADLTSGISEMTPEQLISEQEKIILMIKSESSKTIPDYLFSSVTFSDAEQELIDALTGKYDAVIDALAAKVLPEKVGASNWDKMNPDEKQEKISDLSFRVKDLMNSGRYDDALDLLFEGLSEERRKELMKELLGDEEERRNNDLEERKRRREERIKNGMSPEEADRLFEEEGLLFEENEKKRRRNVLEGLVLDLDAEKNALLKSWKDAKDRLDAEKKRQALLAQLRLQERRLRREKELSSLAQLLSMSRDQDDTLEKDRKRQLDLARARLEAAKRRRAAGLVDEDDDVEPEIRLDSDDVVVLADAVMREMEAKHATERQVLLKLMDTAGPGTDIRLKSEKYSSPDLSNRIRDLREMRKQWRDEDPQTMVETSSEHWDILKEASSSQLVLCSLKSISEDDAQAFILADLQSEQKKETTSIFSGLLEKKPETVRMMAQVQRKARVDCWYDNVARTLLGSSEDQEKKEEEEEVLKALEDKYDALKDKLLAEALMKKLGDKEWASLSEQERQLRIMQIKRQERKLRLEGKYDEISHLFNALAITEEDISRIFGEERTSQEEALKERRERILRLKKERSENGLAVDENEIEKQADEEEKAEKRMRKNILLTLDRNLESERKALLAGLRRQEESISEERRRQLAVAKLRRQRRQLEADEKVSAISFVFQSAKRDEEALLASQAADRERQAALMMKRLSSKTTQKHRKQAFASLTNPAKIVEKLKTLGEEKSEGSSAEKILLQMEKKHLDEREVISLLFLAMEEDSKQKDIKKASLKKLEEDLQNFSKHRRDWREERMMKALDENGAIPLTDGQRSRLSRYVAEQNKDLITALNLKMEVMCRNKSDEVDKEKIREEWMSELAHTQENEMTATTDLIADKTDEILDLLTEDLKRARREGWNDNIVQVIFGLALPGNQDDVRPSSSSSSIELEEREIEEDALAKIKDLEEELIEEKNKIQRKRVSGEEINSEAAISNLEKQFAAKKEALTSDIERQREQMREKLRDRRRRKAETEYEAHAAAGMVILAEQRLQARESHAQTEASKQRNLMQERLAARREKRKMEQENKEKKTNQTTESVTPVPQRPALHRERTVVPVDISDQKKQEMLEALKKRTEQYQKQMQEGKAKQEAWIQKRLEAKKNKESAAGEIIATFQREKTILQDQKTQAMYRQKTILIDRMRTIKTSRTMTLKENQTKSVDKFSKMVEDEDDDGLDKDEKMKKVAEEMQMKFIKKNEEEKQKTPSFREAKKDTSRTSTPADAPDAASLPPRPQTVSRKRDTQEQSRIHKEKMQKRKRERREQLGGRPEEENDPTST